MDFSEAERNGFINAFILFWVQYPHATNLRTEEELRTAAQKLLRGCKEHFRAGVTRLSRINAVVPPEQSDVFVQRAVALVSTSGHDEFTERARLIVRDYPKTLHWLAWWLRPAHASMLFESQRIMDIDIWESIPETTNAEEAMHWKLYAAAGRGHGFFEGSNALYKIAVYYQRLYEEETSKFNCFNQLTSLLML